MKAKFNLDPSKISVLFEEVKYFHLQNFSSMFGKVRKCLYINNNNKKYLYEEEAIFR